MLDGMGVSVQKWHDTCRVRSMGGDINESIKMHASLHVLYDIFNV